MRIDERFTVTKQEISIYQTAFFVYSNELDKGVLLNTFNEVLDFQEHFKALLAMGFSPYGAWLFAADTTTQ